MPLCANSVAAYISEIYAALRVNFPSVHIRLALQAHLLSGSQGWRIEILGLQTSKYAVG